MLRRELGYFLAALGFFTRLPAPIPEKEALARAIRYFTAIGLGVGLAAALVFWLAARLWPQAVAVLFALAAPLALTGALHEDGLADTADGLGGGRDKAHILEIMKDPRAGSFGILALSLALLSKFTLLSSLPASWLPAALVAGHGLSRLAATLLLTKLRYVRDDAHARARSLISPLSPVDILIATLFALPGLFFLPPLRALAGLLLAALVTLWLVRLFHRRLGGITGDCLGATQQISEIIFYLGLAGG